MVNFPSGSLRHSGTTIKKIDFIKKIHSTLFGKNSGDIVSANVLF